MVGEKHIMKICLKCKQLCNDDTLKKCPKCTGELIQYSEEKYKYYFTVHVGEPIYQDNNLEIRRQTIELTDRTYEFYKSTIDEFYKDEEKIEQEYREELIKSNKKIKR